MKKDIKQILVLGMHRSGTSCLAGILKGAGVYFGDVSLNNKFNKKGNHENKVVNQINNTILRKNGGEWYNPKIIESISFKEKLKIFIHNRKMSSRISSEDILAYGIKDPRLIFTHNFWKTKSSIILGTFRHPAKVSESLYIRSQKLEETTRKYTIDNWLEVWYKYNFELLESYKRNNFYFVNFDWPAEQYFEALEYCISQTTNDRIKLDRSFFDESLINQNSKQQDVNNKYLDLYEELNKLSLNMCLNNE